MYEGTHEREDGRLMRIRLSLTLRLCSLLSAAALTVPLRRAKEPSARKAQIYGQN